MVGGYIVSHPLAAAGDAVAGANYGSACMLNGASGGYYTAANEHVAKNQTDYGSTTTAVCTGMGLVTREAMLAAGTAGAGQVIKAGQAAGYSAKAVAAARAV